KSGVGNILSLKIWNNIRKITHRIQPSARYYYLKYKEMINENEKVKALDLLQQGARYYYRDYRINREMALYYMSCNKWNQSFYFWERLRKGNLIKRNTDAIAYATVLKKLNKYTEIED